MFHFLAVLGFVLFVFGSTAVIGNVESIVVDPNQVRRKVQPVTRYGHCPTVYRLLGGAIAIENYPDSLIPQVMADAMEEGGYVPYSHPDQIRAISHLPDLSSPEEARRNIRLGALALREMLPAIRGTLPRKYEGPLLLDRGLVAGGEVTRDQLRARSFPFRHYDEAFTAIRLVEYETGSLTQKTLPHQLRWLEIEGTVPYLPEFSNQGSVLKDRELFHLGYRNLSLTESTVQQLTRLHRAGKFRPSETVRELVLDNLLFTTVESYIEFLRLFPKLESLTISEVYINAMHPYSYIQERNWDSHKRAVEQRCRNFVGQIDFGALFPNLSVIRLVNFRSESLYSTARRDSSPDSDHSYLSHVAFMESYLFPRTPYSRLREISIDGSRVPSQLMRGILELVTKTPTLRTLNLSDDSGHYHEVGLLKPKILENLFALNIQHFRGPFQDWLHKLPTVPLRRLSVRRNTDFSDADLIYLVKSKKFRDLHALSISRTGVTPEGIREIAKMPGLARFTSLDLSSLELGENGTIAEFMHSKFSGGLTSIGLFDCGLNEADLKAIASSNLPYLQSLHLTILRAVPPETARRILKPLFDAGVRIEIHIE